MDGTDGAYPAANAAIEIYYMGSYHIPWRWFDHQPMETVAHADYWRTARLLMLAGF